MRHLAQVHINSASGIELRLLAKKNSEKNWVVDGSPSIILANGKVPDNIELNIELNEGVLVFVELNEDRLPVEISSARDWVLELVQSLAEIQDWRQELTLKSQDLTVRNLELETRKERIEQGLKEEQEALDRKKEELEHWEEKLQKWERELTT